MFRFFVLLVIAFLALCVSSEWQSQSGQRLNMVDARNATYGRKESPGVLYNIHGRRHNYDNGTTTPISGGKRVIVISRGDGDSKPQRRLIRLPDEQRLMNRLFSHYDRHSRPVFNNNDPVIISMSLTIRQIFELDEKNQVLMIDAWVNFEWVDEYLTWDPSRYSNLEVVRIVSWKMWLPDIVLYNNAADFSPNEGFNSRAMVASNGKFQLYRLTIL